MSLFAHYQDSGSMNVAISSEANNMLRLAYRVEQLAHTMSNPIDRGIMLDYARELRQRYA